jgi:transcriptional regulator with XRE-family HTH domain
MKHVFGEYIRRKRKEAGLSQAYVAQCCDVGPGYLGEVERGTRGPIIPSRWEGLADAIPGVTERELHHKYLESIPVRITADPDHPDHLLLLQLQKVLQEQGELSPAQRAGIANILSADTGHD